MLTQSSSGVPRAQSRTWSMAADAADAAEDAPRASMIAMPRCWMVGMKWLAKKSSSTKSVAALPLKSGGQVWGVLAIAASEERDFSTQATFLEAVVQDLSIGLQKNRLYDQLKQRADETMAELKAE